MFHHLTSKPTVLKVFHKILGKFWITLHSFSLFLLSGSLTYFAFLHFYLFFTMVVALVFILLIALTFNMYIKLTCIIGIVIIFFTHIFIIFSRIICRIYYFLSFFHFFIWPLYWFSVFLLIFYMFLVWFLRIVMTIIYQKILLFFRVDTDIDKDGDFL